MEQGVLDNVDSTYRFGGYHIESGFAKRRRAGELEG